MNYEEHKEYLNSLSDTELIELFYDNDNVAFEVLESRYKDYIIGVIKNHLYDLSLVEDAYQHFWESVLRYNTLKNYNPQHESKAPLKNYLAKAAEIAGKKYIVKRVPEKEKQKWDHEGAEAKQKKEKDDKDAKKGGKKKGPKKEDVVEVPFHEVMKVVFMETPEVEHNELYHQALIVLFEELEKPPHMVIVFFYNRLIYPARNDITYVNLSIIKYLSDESILTLTAYLHKEYCDFLKPMHPSYLEPFYEKIEQPDNGKLIQDKLLREYYAAKVDKQLSSWASIIEKNTASILMIKYGKLCKLYGFAEDA